MTVCYTGSNTNEEVFRGSRLIWNSPVLEVTVVLFRCTYCCQKPTLGRTISLYFVGALCYVQKWELLCNVLGMTAFLPSELILNGLGWFGSGFVVVKVEVKHAGLWSDNWCFHLCSWCGLWSAVLHCDCVTLSIMRFSSSAILSPRSQFPTPTSLAPGAGVPPPQFVLMTFMCWSAVKQSFIHSFIHSTANNHPHYNRKGGAST